MNASAIERAIRDTMLGAHGIYASRIAGQFVHGTFEGQPDQAKAMRALAAAPGSGFDVELAPLDPHEASPCGVIGSFRIEALSVVVKVTTRLPAANDTAKRVAVQTATLERLSLAKWALGEPEAITTTAAGEATGVITGLLRSPDGTGYPEIGPPVYDWLLHLATHEIRGRALVRIDRPTETTP